MMMKHFNTKRVLLEEQLISGHLYAINSPEKRHHLQVVLKTKKGDQLRVFNQNCGEWLAQIKDISNKGILIQTSTKLKDPQPKSNLMLAIAPIKHHRFSIAIEKCTEIGVDAFLPLITEHTDSPHIIKQSKLLAYIISATEQSERIIPPSLEEALSFTKFLEKYSDSNVIVCDPRSDAEPILKVLEALDKYKLTVIVIGPEGGFSQKELAMMHSKHIHMASLGNNILRSETAAIFASSCAMAAFLMQYSK